MEELRTRSEKWIRLEDYHKALAAAKPQDSKEKGGRSQQSQPLRRGNDRQND